MPAAIPSDVYKLPLGERVRWARERARLSHDRLAEAINATRDEDEGLVQRSHLIAVEKGRHMPLRRLRQEIATALGVPYELFADPPPLRRVDDQS